MPQLVIRVPSYMLEKDYRKNVRRVIRQAGQEIAKDARALVRAAVGAGRRYGKHQASAPGQPPSSLSGKLAASIKVKPLRGGLRVGITDSAPYALALETGAKGGRRQGRNRKGKPMTARVMLPRPFVSVAADAKAPELAERIPQALKTGLRLKEIK